MKTQIAIAISLLLAASNASATKPKPPTPEPTPTPIPGNTNTNTNENRNDQTQTNRQGQGQGQGQAQGQGQQQGQSATGGSGGMGGDGGSGVGIGQGGTGGQGTAVANGGNGTGGTSSIGTVNPSSDSVASSESRSDSVSGASSDSLSGAVSENEVNVGGDSNNYRSVALALPTIQTAAPSFAASTNIVVESGVCGPRMEKISDRVTGVLGKVKIDLGSDDDLRPLADPYRYWTSPSGTVHIFGHRISTYAAANSVASSRGWGIGGNNSGLAGGQFGASANSAATRTVLRIVIADCELPQQVREVPQVIYREAKQPRG